jgi:hypothetical protein
MRLSRFVDLVDLGVAAVVVAMLALPARTMYAGAAHGGTEAERFALALAEARTIAHPEDGAAIDDLSRRLSAAGEKDWALEIAVRGSERARQSPTRWRALLAASVAFDRRLDVVPALDYASRALSLCDDQPSACPSWERARLSLYQQQLDAGVKSGIDPHRDLEAFRRAAESARRQIRLGGHDVERGSATPALAPGAPPPEPSR